MYPLNEGSTPSRVFNEVRMRFTENEIPNVGSYWHDNHHKRFRVMMITNQGVKEALCDEYPLMVAYRDAQNNFFSLPLDKWYDKMNLIKPSEV